MEARKRGQRLQRRLHDLRVGLVQAERQRGQQRRQLARCAQQAMRLGDIHLSTYIIPKPYPRTQTLQD